MPLSLPLFVAGFENPILCPVVRCSFGISQNLEQKGTNHQICEEQKVCRMSVPCTVHLIEIDTPAFHSHAYLFSLDPELRLS